MKPFNPNNNYRVLTPEGTYIAHVEFAKERVSHKGAPYISLGFRLNDTRVLFRNYFVDGDPTSFSVQRSSEELSNLCRVVGHAGMLTDPAQLINGVEFNLTVTHYTDSNGIRREQVRVH